MDVTDSSTEWRPTTFPTYEKHENLAQKDFNIEISQGIIQYIKSKGLRMHYLTQPLKAAKNGQQKKSKMVRHIGLCAK